MKDKRKVTHSFTAYQCKICHKYHSDNLLIKSEENEDPIDLAELLDEYFGDEEHQARGYNREDE